MTVLGMETAGTLAAGSSIAGIHGQLTAAENTLRGIGAFTSPPGNEGASMFATAQHKTSLEAGLGMLKLATANLSEGVSHTNSAVAAHEIMDASGAAGIATTLAI